MRLSWYPIVYEVVAVMRLLVFVFPVCMLKECEGDGNAGRGTGAVWLC